MKRLFEANEKELSDLRGDPNFILKVQSLIKEAFKVKKQRRTGIANEIANEFGAFALPGIISSTYIFSEKLKEDSNMQNWLVGLIYRLIKDNPSAKKLLVISGLAHSPFKTTQLITLDVLKKVENLSLTEDEMEELNYFFQNMSIGQDNKVLIGLLEVLWKLEPEKYFETGISLLRSYIISVYGDDLKTARKIANKLLNYFPHRSTQIFRLIFDSVDPKGKEASNEFSNINLEDDNLKGLFSAANEILIDQRRNKVIELIFRRALSRLLRNKPDLIENHHNSIFNSYHHLIRYWLQAIGENFPKDFTIKYYKNHAFSLDEPEASKWIVVQLLFKESNYEAKQLLMEIEERNPEGYDMGKKQYDLFKKPNVISNKVKGGRVLYETWIEPKNK